MEKAIWDPYYNRIFCDICKDETNKNNRLGGCLNKKGYKNLEERFFSITERYLKKQFKNRWDSMKKEYTQWQELKIAAAGLGWDDRLETIGADNAWWKLHLMKHPEHAKYRNGGPANLSEMDVMFDNAYVTGASSTIPGEISQDDDLALGDDRESLDDDDDVEIIVSSLKKPNKSAKRNAKSSTIDVTYKEDKNSFLREYKKTMEKINTSIEESSSHVPNLTSSVKDVLKLMVECRAVEGTVLYYAATMLV